jgi:hypothetical protein
LKILKQKISVFEEAEHAEVHANAGHEPSLLGRMILRFANLAAEPEIHRRCGKQQRCERRVPRAVKDVAGNDEKIFAKVPAAQAPVERRNNDVEDDEGERIKKHGGMLELRGRWQTLVYASHIEADVLEVVCKSGKIDLQFL